MYILKAGEGCVLKMRLVEANGAPIELRNARFVQAILHLPNEATMLCEDVRFDEVSQLVFVRLSAKSELTMEGVYGININALFDGRRVVTSAVLDFAEVKANAESRYYELLIDLIVSTTDVPSCVKYTGASPKISENGTWLVFNDEINAFEDTGISIFGKSAYQAAIESGIFSGTEDDFNAYMGRIPQVTNAAILATESANKATENANKAGAEAVRIATESANKATAATENANQAAQRANEEVENLKDKADTNGYYPDMSVGMADNLVGRGDVQDAQINFRPSAGADNISDAAARIERIKGNSVVWNQQLPLGLVQIDLDNTEGSAVLTRNFAGASREMSIKANHIYYACANDNVDNRNIFVQIANFNQVSINIIDGAIITAPYDRSGYFVIKVPVGQSVKGTMHPQVIDLTQMFGAGNEPTTVEEYYQRKPMNIADEFAYNEGELIDMKVDSLISTSDNAYDYVKGYARVMGGHTYDCSYGTAFVEKVYFSTNKDNIVAEENAMTSENGKYTFPSDGYAVPYTTDGDVREYCVCLQHSYTKPHPAHQQEVKDLSFIGEAFPEGMRSTGSAFDEIRFNPTKKVWEKVTRIGAVDLGELSFNKPVLNREGTNDYTTVILPDKKNGYYNVLCSNFITVTRGEGTSVGVGKVSGGASINHVFFGVESGKYANASEVKSAMSGVMLNYELAEPIVEEIDLSPNFNPDYLAWDFGTEESIASVPSAPFRADINYEPNAVDDLRWAVSEIRSLRAELAQLQSAQTSETNLTE